MDEKGHPHENLIKLLKAAREKDMKYADGRILSSMCTTADPVACEAHRLFFDTNLGDAGLFEGTKSLEKEAVKILGDLLGNPGAAGFIVSGGTEANLTALWAARNTCGKERTEVLLPETAHFSFQKAADILGLELVKIPVGDDHTMDTAEAGDMISARTAALVGIAGSTEYGIVDDIPALSALAVEEGVHLHVDAAFGGFVLPFLKRMGRDVPSFDFSLPGVSSITIDPHKMGLSVIPSGGILFRDESFLDPITTPSPYLTEKTQHTLLGTRSGASAAATWAVMKLLGRRGYQENVKKCMERTMDIYTGLQGLGISAIEPTMNILVFSHPEIEGIDKGLKEKGWVVSHTRKGEIRLVIMPHVKKEHADAFLIDVKGVLEDL